MSVSSTATLVPLSVVSLLGIALAGFGYRLVPHFLRWTGWLGGATLGGILGWQFLPELMSQPAPEQQIAWTAALVVVGAVLGRMFLPLATRLAAVIAGFLSTAGAVGIFFVGDSIRTRLTGVDLTTEPVETTVTLAVEFERLFAAQGVELLAILLAAGLAGAIVATRYHTELIAAGLTISGAFLLGIALPLWQTAVVGSVELGVGTSSASATWTVIALIAGVIIQLIDHRREDDPSPSFSID